MALAHARVMLHQPASCYYEGQSADCTIETNEVLILKNNILELYAERTDFPAQIILENMERDVFLSAEDAQGLRIVDIVADS